MAKMTDAAPRAHAASWRDYYELCKPRVVLLMLLTSVIGMFMATPGMVPWQVLVFGNLGIALCAASAAAVNHLVDRRIDLVMARTHNRPIAQGRVDTLHAILFALVLGVVGMAILITQINQLTAWLTLASLLGYAVVYTLWLKRATPQNIVIGGLALLLVLIIFAWTPPHFWALAIHRRDDYAKADIPMLPVTHGIRYTKLHTLLYTLILFAVTLMPYASHMSGPLYFFGAIALGLGFIYWAIVMMIGKNPNAAMQTFRYSIVYLMALFVIMLLDHYLFPIQLVLEAST
jgi:protoheme IX farnesyltransferase